MRGTERKIKVKFFAFTVSSLQATVTDYAKRYDCIFNVHGDTTSRQALMQCSVSIITFHEKAICLCRLFL